MWVWRAFFFGLSFALFTAISSPARALENSPPAYNNNTDSILADFCSDIGNTDHAKNELYNIQLIQALQNVGGLSEHIKSSHKLSDHHFDDDKSVKGLPTKTPAYQIGFNHNASHPPFERQAASAFSTVLQNEPIFVLVYEFLPETLGLKHFLAPLITNNIVPWYLRPDAANGHSRLAGWKDGNTLYTGTITYLS